MQLNCVMEVYKGQLNTKIQPLAQSDCHRGYRKTEEGLLNDSPIFILRYYFWRSNDVVSTKELNSLADVECKFKPHEEEDNTTLGYSPCILFCMSQLFVVFLLLYFFFHFFFYMCNQYPAYTNNHKKRKKTGTWSNKSGLQHLPRNCLNTSPRIHRFLPEKEWEIYKETGRWTGA